MATVSMDWTVSGISLAGRSGAMDAYRFTSFGSELSAHGMSLAIDVFRQLAIDKSAIQKIFPHASSKRDWNNGADTLGVKELMFHIYPDYGNVVSASVPAGIALAREKGANSTRRQAGGMGGLCRYVILGLFIFLIIRDTHPASG